ncbi:MAG: TetR/AcrR family transcriptional regulator [Tissierella sp.]|uniref:TetR/AcrR family transcriptional regulator n=1 Tax=Tissierella sp. TaxID=41274 RepID=UPI003F99C7B7
MIKIEDLLINIDKEKRDKIINSAMKEFSTNTFAKASTNVIVENAEISKGLLFHYFGTKNKLYNYLEYFCIKVISDEIIEKLDWNQKDFFLRLKEISIIKFSLLEKYPYLFDFAIIVLEDKTIEGISETNPDFPIELYSQIYTYNIDYSLFKEDIDIKKSINIIRWTLEKYSEEMRRNINYTDMKFDYKMIEKEIYEYIDMLKVCFYR